MNISTEPNRPLNGQLKKREMKKRHSPHTPYREKAKGKETSPGSYENLLSPRGRVRAREASRYVVAGAAAEELIDILDACHTKSNRSIWAYYCYHYDIDLLMDKAYELKSKERQGELRNAVTAFQHWLSTSFPRRKEVR